MVGKLERDFKNRMSWWDHKDEDKGCSDDDQECWDLVFFIFKKGVENSYIFIFAV